MKKYLFLILALIMTVNLYATPDSNMTIATVSDGGTIEASEHNTARNTISSTYNAHSHTDITSLTSLGAVGTITTGVWNGTAVPVLYGGTGSTTASGARTALGLAIGTDVQAYDADLTTYAGITPSSDIQAFLAVANDSAARTELGLAIGSNVQAYDAQLVDLADGTLSGAGTVDTAALTGTTYVPDATVDTTALKTATSEVTGNTTYANYTLTGGQYCFYPQVKMSGTDAQDWWATICHANGLTTFAGWTTYATNISLYSGSAGTISAIARYVTASGIDYWLWIWVDKSTKDIMGMSGAPDHVAYGNGDDFEAMPHPFRDYNSDTQDVILIEKSQAKAIQVEAKDKGLSVLELVDRDYKIDFTKTYPYVPIHSGQFSPDKSPVLVESIPNYIQIRKLVLMTNKDKMDKKKKQEDKQIVFEAEKILKENKKQAVLEKLNITNEDLELLLK